MPRELQSLSDLGPRPLDRLERNLLRARSAIETAARRGGRDASEVQLLAVTKYVTPDVVRALHSLGVRDFGENRVQDALGKIEDLEDLEGARWHFIGHLQRNKARQVVERFHAFHALDSLRLAEEIERRIEEASGAPIELWVEVNVSGEPQKTGLAPDDLDALLERVRGSKILAARCRGLMGMAEHSERAEDSRASFRRLRKLRDQAVRSGLLPASSGLSMGMSGDFDVAIEEGANVVRIGSLLFEEPGAGD